MATTLPCSSETAKTSPPGHDRGAPHCQPACCGVEDSRRGITDSLIKFEPDVVHIHNTFPLVTPSVLYACRDASVPVVATLHNYKLGCASGTFFRDGRVCHDCLGGSSLHALAHGCYRGSAASTAPVVLGSWLHRTAWRTMITAYIFISGAQRELLAPVGLPADRSFVKHNFVPPPPPHREIATEPQVAYVGRLDEPKGAPFLMRAWDAFRARRPRSPLRLIVVGGGEMSAGNDPLGNSASLRDDGWSRLASRRCPESWPASRAVIVPSQWEETFGMVAVEAMAAGTAPVASAHGAFPELITHGSDGALFPPTGRRRPCRHLGRDRRQPAAVGRVRSQCTQTYRSRFSPDAGIDPAAGDLPLRDVAPDRSVPAAQASRSAASGRHVSGSDHITLALRTQRHTAPATSAWPDPGGAAPRLGCGRPRHLEPEQLRARTVRGALLRCQQLRGIRARLHHLYGGYQCRAWLGDGSSPRPVQRRSRMIAGAARRRRPREPPSPSVWPLVSCASSPGCSCPIRSGRYSSRWASGCLDWPCRTAGGSPSSPRGRGSVSIPQRPVLDRAARPGSRRDALAGETAQRVACSPSAGPPRLPPCWEWFRPGPCHDRSARWDGFGTHSELSVRYLVENVSISGASQLRSFVLGAVAGLAAVGYVRASEILMGPFLVVLMGISQVAVPEASRVFHRNPGRLRRFCLLLGGVQAAAAIVWGVFLMMVFPLGPGPALLKELWIPTAQLLPAITLTVAAASFVTAATAGLRAMGVARRSLRAQLIGFGGIRDRRHSRSHFGGAVGTSWGVTIAECFAAFVWWHQLRSALSDHHTLPEVIK